MFQESEVSFHKYVTAVPFQTVWNDPTYIEYREIYNVVILCCSSVVQLRCFIVMMIILCDFEVKAVVRTSNGWQISAVSLVSVQFLFISFLQKLLLRDICRTLYVFQ